MAKKTTPNAAPDWRAEVAELVERAREVLHDKTLDEVTGDEGNGPHAFQLIFEARSKLEDASALAGRDPDEILLSAWSMLMGARDMKHNHRVLPAMLEPAIASLEQAYGIASRNLPLPLADAEIASPGPATQADGASDEDGDERSLLALRAAWEIDGLAELVCDQTDGDGKGLPLRSMLRRIRRLSCIQMSALGDDSDALKDIQARFDETAVA